MGTNSKIEWTTHTWNPWYGCPDDGRRSPACDHCYARAWAKRSGIVDFDREIKRASDKTFYAPLNRKKFKSGDKVFVCSLSDFFHEDAEEFQLAALDIMSKRLDLTWLLLTKRPENISKIWNYLSGLIGEKWPLKNIWLGVTVENQEQAEKRIPELFKNPGAPYFISCEPLLDEIHIEPYLLSDYDKAAQMLGTECRTNKIGWVIAGGESGSGARPSHPNAFRFLRNQCEEWGTPFFFKQWGSNPHAAAFEETIGICARLDLPKRGNLLDGKIWNEFPS